MAKNWRIRGRAQLEGNRIAEKLVTVRINCVVEQRVRIVRAGRLRSASIRLDVRRPYDCGVNLVASSTICRSCPRAADAQIPVRPFFC
jgi:hypothetical protein